MLIDGKLLAEGLLAQIKQSVQNLTRPPIMVDFVMENDLVQLQYAKIKKRMAASVGIECRLNLLSDAVTTEGLKAELQSVNISGVDGILVQLPLPYYIDTPAVLSVINPGMDIDCITPFCKERFYAGNPVVVPPTAKAIAYMIDSLKINFDSPSVYIIGQGELVGKPTAALLRKMGFQVEVGDVYTPDIAAQARMADIIIAAAGKPGLVTSDFVKPGAIVIDAGASEEGGQILGDVNLASVTGTAGYVSPVPGGVGPLNVAMLFENLLHFSIKNAHK